jgi:glycerol kinase
MAKYVMALDSGTTSNRCILFNEKGETMSLSQNEFTQIIDFHGQITHLPSFYLLSFYFEIFIILNFSK